ncbi:MAG: AMP-binding protein [Streptosporangiaceae bacterium]
MRAAYEGYRLSPQQQRLWSLWDVDGDVGHLAQCAAVIHGPLDPQALNRALIAVAERNEILRTTFHAVPTMTFPVQVISDVPDIGYRQAGGEVAILPDEDTADPERLLSALAQRAVTVAALVPSLLHAALGVDEPPPLPALRCLLSTGEPLPPALAGRWLSAYPHTQLVNAYGSAECADNVSQQDIGQDLGDCPIGRPIRGVRIYLLDRELAPVPARHRGRTWRHAGLGGSAPRDGA